MEGMNHDFSSLCEQLKLIHTFDESIQKKALRSLKYYLNSFFGDQCKCNDVIYTRNTDKDIFGIMITPYAFDSKQYLYDADDRINIYGYRLELDSKLFDSVILSCNSFDTCKVILSMILHDINKFTSVSCLENVYSIIDSLVVKSNSNIRIEELVSHPHMFGFVTSQTLRTSTSVMCANPNDILTDDFIQGYGLIDELNEGLRCVNTYRAFPQIQRYPNSHYLTAQWYVDVINNADPDDFYVKRLIEKMYRITSSELVKCQLNSALKEITPTDSLRETANTYIVEENIKETKRRMGIFAQIRRNGLRSIEEDLYEYTVRVKNIESEEDAVLLMRQLNSRIEILDDYIMTEKLSDSERKRWDGVLEKYMKLRETLSKKAVYKQKMYGLFVDYNALQNMPNSNSLMNTYY